MLPILTQEGPVAKEYLDIIYRVTWQAVDEYRRVLVCRFDLTLPHGVPLPDDAYSNQPLQRCLASFQAKVDQDRLRRQSPHACRVRYVVAREISSDGMPHFHLMLFFNLHAYNTPGTVDYEGRNLFVMLCEAWASALRVPVETARPGVQLCRGRLVEQAGWHGPMYTHYYLEPGNHYAALPAMFLRGSYLCKLYSKRFGDGHRAFLHSHR
ncbi:MAG: inovirus-type Gp2 protein [Halomonas sp.]|uniref:YagK/YfjJ domain-containing protein n=1 Tax=Halomonas sp. TaxID=1486246 RepID=UPI002ACDCBCA|nr:inovirus-type Gp2 protein [Halomonas sp.]MDZ7852300.1 inovirus-type Gp2 protein [Halomonas sp.]